MGFLTSSFMKSYAIRMKLQAQRRVMDINLQASRVQKQIGRLQKQLKSQQKAQMATLQGSLQGYLYGNSVDSATGMSTGGLYAQYNAALKSGDNATAQSIFSSIQQAQSQYSMQSQGISAYWDDYMESQLEPLKDEEERLSIEKNQAENELALWTETEKSYAQHIKEDIKSVIPDAG